jgi:hypothetical protein
MCATFSITASSRKMWRGGRGRRVMHYESGTGKLRPTIDAESVERLRIVTVDNEAV